MTLQADKQKYIIAAIWTLILAGSAGIVSPLKDYFLLFTPLNLLILISFLLISIDGLKKETLQPFLIIGISSWLIEVIGVQTHLIFGPYKYGDNLGPKILEVPLLIGANWALLAFVTGIMSNYLFKQKSLKVFSAALLMVVLDFFMEQVVFELDYWHFQNKSAPLINYLSWFIISFFAQLYFQSRFSALKSHLSFHLYFAQLLFFIFLFYSK